MAVAICPAIQRGLLALARTTLAICSSIVRTLRARACRLEMIDGSIIAEHLCSRGKASLMIDDGVASRMSCSSDLAHEMRASAAATRSVKAPVAIASPCAPQ